MASGNRPLSPHLGVYRLQWTMLYSGLHRISGFALVFGVVAFVAWICALAAGPQAFATAQAIALSPLGLIALAGWSWSLFYHLLNGIRHLVWDTGRALSLDAARRSGHVVIATATALTLLVWAVSFFVGG